MRMLQLATLVQRHLTLEEFQHALAVQPGTSYRSLEDRKLSPDFLEPGQMVISRLQYHSGGLLDVQEELEVENDSMTQYQEVLQRFMPHFFSPDLTKPRQEMAELRGLEIGPSDVYRMTFSARKPRKSFS